MEVVRDCLDKQVVDRHGRPMGRVDGIVIDVANGKQPQVTYIEIGAVTRWRRFHPSLGQLVKKIARRMMVVSEDPYRIPWQKVVTTGIEVIVSEEAEKTPALGWERWLRRKIISKIPGA